MLHFIAVLPVVVLFLASLPHTSSRFSVQLGNVLYALYLLMSRTKCDRADLTYDIAVTYEIKHFQTEDPAVLLKDSGCLN